MIDDEFMRKARVLSEKTGLELDEILEKVQEYIEEMGGLIKPDGALSLLASDLGVSLETPQSASRTTIRLDKLVPGMRRATVRGRISKIYGTLEYVNSKGENSERVELRISDDYGQVDVVVWSQRLVDLFKSGQIREGDEVLLTNVRVSNRGGRVVVHLNSESKIDLIARGSSPEDEIISRVEEVYGREGEEVDFRGIVVRIFPASEFVREDGSRGRRCSAIVQGDDGNTVRVLFWGDKVSLSDVIQPGSQVILRNFRVVAREEGWELHSTARSRVEVESGKTNLIIATVLYKFPTEESLLGKKYSDLLIEVDGKLEILRVWGEFADVLEGIEPPFIVRVGPVFRRYDDLLSLSRAGTLEIPEVLEGKVRDSISNLALSLKYKRVPIGESSDGFREFRGTVIGISDEARISWHCPICGSRVSHEYGSFYCPNCGRVERAEPLLHLTLTLDDGSGIARVVAFGKKAEKILGMTTDEVLRRADELGQLHHSVPTDELSSRIIGKEVVVRGRATYTESGLVKVILDDMEEADYVREAELLMKEIRDLWLGDEEF